ncbi:hypothetical protein SAMN05216571_11172 [Onishia taeanensis]|uniref:Uncharacterized protein n=1 Tax=Onishia taeanensis TaxID=284577 RepID=A0A1G7TSV9_9GAMM|nr:hypothetical protein SAMN05216571_11172 [Halomonas taeanensis]
MSVGYAGHTLFVLTALSPDFVQAMKSPADTELHTGSTGLDRKAQS